MIGTFFIFTLFLYIFFIFPQILSKITHILRKFLEIKRHFVFKEEVCNIFLREVKYGITYCTYYSYDWRS